MMKKLFNKRHYVGLLLLFFSLAPYVVPYKNGLLLTICYAMYCFGIAFMCDYFAEKIGSFSFLHHMLKSRKSFKIYFLISLFGGLVLDGLATYFGGLWYYPFYSNWVYWSVVVLAGGFGFYFLTILLSYLSIKLILDKFYKGRKKITKSYKYESYLYKFLLFIGLLGLSIVLGQILKSTNLLINFFFNISTQKNPYLQFRYIILAFFSIWMILEFVQFKKSRNSLLKDLLHGYITPILAIYIASILLALYMEIQNVPIRLWVYTNWPWQDIKVLGLPIFIYLTWPLHYVGFLSLYHAFGDELSSEIWAGDKIK